MVIAAHYGIFNHTHPETLLSLTHTKLGEEGQNIKGFLEGKWKNGDELGSNNAIKNENKCNKIIQTNMKGL